MFVFVPIASADNVAYGIIGTSSDNSTWLTYHPDGFSALTDNNFGTSTYGRDAAGTGTDTLANSNQIAPNTSYINLDLGSVMNIDRIQFAFQYTGNGGANTIWVNVNVSSDNITWTEVKNYSTSPGTYVDVNDTIYGPNLNGIRYIRSSLWYNTNYGSNTMGIFYREMQAFDIPTPLTPSNGSLVNKTYPPLTSDTNFTWSSGTDNYHLLISKDINFNLISVDTTVANNYSVQSLEAGNYWWKVRYYNSTSGTYGNYSDTFNFTLTNTQTISGTNIQGTVSELISGTITPISSATVYIYNTTWSSYMATGSNGYYLFTGLAADTYTLYATKADYETSPLSYVTPTANNTSINNINMVRYVSPYITNFVYETILIQNIFGTPYVGSTVTLYEGDGVVAYKTATTDSTGQAVFYVIKDQKYRLTISGGGLSGTLTYWIYGKEETYPIIIVSGFPTGGNRDTDISTNLTVTDINATHKNLNLVYNDIIGSTSQIWFYATNISTGVTCTQNSTADSVTLSCAVLASGTYQFGFNATSTKYGYFKDNMVVNFNAGYPNTPIIETNVDHTLLQWASIIILVVLASLFSVTTIKFGAVILPLSAMVLWVFGWFEPAIGNPVLSLGLLSTALVLGVLIYMRMSEAKVVYQ